MKSLTKYLNKKLVIFPSQVDEKLVINKDYNDPHPHTYYPISWEELKKIIEDRYNKFGPGTKDKPIDFNDVDVSNIDSFYNKNTNNGIFDGTEFEYINISDWNVSKVKDMQCMFCRCTQLKSVGDISDWNVSNVEYMTSMFQECEQLKSVGDLSNWNISNIESMRAMFYECIQLKSVGDLSNWNVSAVRDMTYMFSYCYNLKSVGDLSRWNVSKVEYMKGMFFNCKQLTSVGDLSNWKVSKVKNMSYMFDNSGIINTPKWYKK